MNYEEMISDKAKCVDASGIRTIWQMAAQMTDPVNFSIGQPDFDASEEVKAAAIQAINDGHNGYTMTTGYQPLRDAISAKITAELGWDNPEVMISCGVSGGLNLAFTTLINPGDEVLIPDPYFVMYNHLVNMNGGKCVFVDTYPEFQLDAAEIEKHITERSKILIVNSPANPTGTVYTEEQLKAVAEVARKHNLIVISDEIYQEFSYDGPCPSIAKYYGRTIVLGGYSKAYGVPGWRLGYVAMPAEMKELFETFATLQQYSFVCAPHPFQVAAVTALQSDISGQIDAYRHKRNLIYEGLRDKFGLVKPMGAFYAFVPAPGGDAKKFVSYAIKEYSVLIIPGTEFSQRNTHFRISYAANDEMIKDGVQRLCRAAETFS